MNAEIARILREAVTGCYQGIPEDITPHVRAVDGVDPLVLRSALSRCLSEYPTQLPPPARLRALCGLPEANNRSRRDREYFHDIRHRMKSDQETWEHIELNRHLEVKISPEWEALAQKWENESEELQIHPDADTPEDITKRRMAEFWELMGRTKVCK